MTPIDFYIITLVNLIILCTLRRPIARWRIKRQAEEWQRERGDLARARLLREIREDDDV